MRRHRTFIGLDLGKNIRDRLASLQENLQGAGADVKWVEHANLHVTLLFLGEVNERTLRSLCRVVGSRVAGMAGYVLKVEGTGCFPNPRRPRVLWAGIGQGAEETVALHDALEGPVMELGGFRRENRRFTPHITLGRVRGAKGGETGEETEAEPTPETGGEELAAALRKYEHWKGGETTIGEVLVMSSQLTPKGPVYTVLSRAKLA